MKTAFLKIIKKARKYSLKIGLLEEETTPCFDYSAI
jgi:hypothetical protein